MPKACPAADGGCGGGAQLGEQARGAGAVPGHLRPGADGGAHRDAAAPLRGLPERRLHHGAIAGQVGGLHSGCLTVSDQVACAGGTDENEMRHQEVRGHACSQMRGTLPVCICWLRCHNCIGLREFLIHHMSYEKCSGRYLTGSVSGTRLVKDSLMRNTKGRPFLEAISNR